MTVRVILIYLYLVINMAVKSTDDLEQLRSEIQMLSRQMMMQQFYVEEISRSNSNSGLKRVRLTRFGERPYLSASHVDNNIASIHNHANHIRTIGLGEMVVVMNGIEFRTRHNDYMLKKKHSTSKRFKATEDIEFPDVPPEVLAKDTVQGQVEEMKEWFRAWKEQDDSKRDYKKYFRPILCYMEGFWMTTKMNEFEEPFDSDRHFVDAKTWLDLQDMARFFSYSGTMMSSENFSYLPTSIMIMGNNDTTPILAQWIYRILCQPLKDDLPTSFLRPVLDLKTQVAFGIDAEKYERSPYARFYLSRRPNSRLRVIRTLLDDLMEQIPGLDNDQADLRDDVYGEPSYSPNGNQRLNTGYYHREYRVSPRKGSSKRIIRHRSFADQFLYVAQNTQNKVPPSTLKKCNRRRKYCRTWSQRYSYAIPLEIVYMTPLLRWNPHGFTYRGDGWKRDGQKVFVDQKTGRKSLNGRSGRALNGTNSNRYFQTPYELFEEPDRPRQASRIRGVRFVLDRDGVERPVRASGTFITLPDIPGLGPIRTRYPIMPIHGEGSSVWKELSAVQDVVINPGRYDDLLQIRHDVDAVPDRTFVFWTNPALPIFDIHRHMLVIDEAEVRAVKASSADGLWSIEVVTEEILNHQHVIILTCDPDTGVSVMVSCDGSDQFCDDGHDGFEGEDASSICDL